MLKTVCFKVEALVLTLALILPGMALSASDPDSIDFVTLYQQAGFAGAAYGSEAGTREFVESQDYRVTLRKTDARSQVSYFLATNETARTHIISIRGTSNIENAMLDLAFKLRLDPTTGIYFHDGFTFAAERVYDELKPLLNPEYRIYTTGHSLGGAIALILAKYLDLHQFRLAQATTFGQPKVTNVAGAGELEQLNLLRVVMPLDLVPLVPPFDPLDINNVDIYWHAGREVILLEGDQYAVLQGLESMLRATRFTQRLLSQENVDTHQMSAYIRMLEAKTKSARQVPYKTDLNLFNLFGSQ